MMNKDIKEKLESSSLQMNGIRLFWGLFFALYSAVGNFFTNIIISSSAPPPQSIIIYLIIHLLLCMNNYIAQLNNSTWKLSFKKSFCSFLGASQRTKTISDQSFPYNLIRLAEQFPERPKPHILNPMLMAAGRIHDIQTVFLTGLAEAHTRHSLLSQRLTQLCAVWQGAQHKHSSLLSHCCTALPGANETTVWSYTHTPTRDCTHACKYT